MDAPHREERSASENCDATVNEHADLTAETEDEVARQVLVLSERSAGARALSRAERQIVTERMSKRLEKVLPRPATDSQLVARAFVESATFPL